MMMMRLNAKLLREGMREGDLADLVLPLISCDEYASKVDNDQAIVIGFYVQEELAAKDLNRFLQKSAVPILGTDISPAPDQHGYFMVFVEMMNNHRLGENLEAILLEIHGLVDIDNWQLRVRESDRLLPFTPENLQRAVAKARHVSKKAEVVEYLQRSALHNAEFIGPILVLEGAGERYCFDFIDFAPMNCLLDTHQLTDTGMRYDIRSIAKTNKINRLLGENWNASRVGQYIILHTERDSRGLLLRL